MKLIDKDSLLVEIDKRKIGYNTDGKHTVEYNTVKKILDILDTLEVKEVDLDKPLGEVKIHTSMESGSLDEVILTTKYIAQKGE